MDVARTNVSRSVLRGLANLICLGSFALSTGCVLFNQNDDQPDDSNDNNGGKVAPAPTNDDDAFKPPEVDEQGKTKPPNPNTMVSANPTGCSGEGETFSSERGRCYRFVSQPALSWTNAAVDCSLWSAGRGHLVAITSQEEDDFVRTFGAGSLWIGGSDAKMEGDWRWLSQEVWFFQNFEVGRPDNIDSLEHCLSKQESGLWNDLPCDVKLPYMCERAVQ